MDIRFLQRLPLFRDFSEMEIRAALHALGAVEKEFSLGDTVLSAGSLNERFGLVLDGSVLIESNDLWGNRTLLSHAGRGQIFGESGGAGQYHDQAQHGSDEFLHNSLPLLLSISGHPPQEYRDEPIITTNCINVNENL